MKAGFHHHRSGQIGVSQVSLAGRIRSDWPRSGWHESTPFDAESSSESSQTKKRARVGFAPRRSASVNVAPAKPASVRLAPLRLARPMTHTKTTHSRLAPLRLAPVNPPRQNDAWVRSGPT